MQSKLITVTSSFEKINDCSNNNNEYLNKNDLFTFFSEIYCRLIKCSMLNGKNDGKLELHFFLQP